jgi:hypothetical protein
VKNLNTDVPYAELHRLIKLETQTKTPDVVTVSVKSLVESLVEVTREVEKNHKEAMKAWKETLKTYVNFISKHPGSTQIKAPEKPPSKPSSYQTLKSYIRMFKAFKNEHEDFTITMLKEVFNISSQVMVQSYDTKSYYQSLSTGSAIMNLSYASV